MDKFNLKNPTIKNTGKYTVEVDGHEMSKKLAMTLGYLPAGEAQGAFYAAAGSVPEAPSRVITFGGNPVTSGSGTAARLNRSLESSSPAGSDDLICAMFQISLSDFLRTKHELKLKGLL